MKLPEVPHSERARYDLGVTHGDADVNSIRLHYVMGGRNDAEPLVLLHGFPQSWVMWRRVWPALVERYRVIAVDLRGVWGFGETTGY